MYVVVAYSVAARRDLVLKHACAPGLYSLLLQLDLSPPILG